MKIKNSILIICIFLLVIFFVEAKQIGRSPCNMIDIDFGPGRDNSYDTYIEVENLPEGDEFEITGTGSEKIDNVLKFKKTEGSKIRSTEAIDEDMVISILNNPDNIKLVYKEKVVCKPIKGFLEQPALDEDELAAQQMILAYEALDASTPPSRRGGKGEKITFLSCNDSDGGKNYYEAGNITVVYVISEEIKNITFYDECDEGKLFETYCKGKRPAIKRKTCPDACGNGACVGNESIKPVVDFVNVDNADPTAGGTTQIIITAQITDEDDVDDINLVSALFIVGNPANGNNITIERSSCVDIDLDTIECNATYDMQFYDDAMTYTIEVYAEDYSGTNDTGNDSFDYSELVSLELDTTTIAFGFMNLGQSREVLGDNEMDTNNSATIKNQGNAIIDAKIKASDFIGLLDNFSSSQAQSQFGLLGYYNLTNDYRTEDGLDLTYGENELSSVDFKLTIPDNVSFGSFISNINIIAISDS